MKSLSSICLLLFPSRIKWMISCSLLEILYFENIRIISASDLSLRERFFIRLVCHVKMSAAKSKTERILNHHVSQNGGVIIIFMDASSLFHMPSLLEPLTLKIYSPAPKLVKAISCLWPKWIQLLSILFLERYFSMMFLLISYVPANFIYLRMRIWKCSISALPMVFTNKPLLFVNKFWWICFYATNLQLY